MPASPATPPLPSISYAQSPLHSQRQRPTAATPTRPILSLSISRYPPCCLPPSPTLQHIHAQTAPQPPNARSQSRARMQRRRAYGTSHAPTEVRLLARVKRARTGMLARTRTHRRGSARRARAASHTYAGTRCHARTRIQPPPDSPHTPPIDYNI